MGDKISTTSQQKRLIVTLNTRILLEMTEFRGGSELLAVLQHAVSQNALCLRVTQRPGPASDPGHGVEDSPLHSVRW